MTATIKLTNGDWTIDARTGRPVTITDTAKLQQDLGENLNIARQTNGFGAGLDDIIGRVEDPFVIRALVEQNIAQSVTAMQRLQDRYQRTQRTTAERILRVDRLSVAPTTMGGGNLQTGFAYTLSVRSVAGTPVSSTTVVSG